jgi:hypothetical protein
MGVLKVSHWKTLIKDCDTVEELDNILDLILEKKEDFSEQDRYELGMVSIKQALKFTGVK